MVPALLVRRDAELIETEIDGDMVALDVARGTCFGFNATASRIWAIIENPTPAAEIVATLIGEFAVDPAVCERDVAALLDTLREQGLIRMESVAG